jgi:CRP/FNR family transcriptional regulator
MTKNDRKCINCKLKSKAACTLTAGELARLEKGCVEGKMDKSVRLFNEGMIPSQVIYLKEGFVKIHKNGIRKKDQILKIAKPGSYLGLQTIFGDWVNHYSATTINDVKACFIDIGVFKELIQSNSSFAYELIVLISQEELIYFQRFVDQYQKQLNGRLADALIFLSAEIFKSDEFTLPFTKYDLAALIGSTRESVTRTIKAFKDADIIGIEGKRIKLINMEKLQHISRTG